MMAHDSALKTVKVKKKKLLTKLRENRAKHAHDYEEAVEEYWKALHKELGELVEKAGKRKGWQYEIKADPPKDYTKEYDDAIELLEWEIADEVDLSNADFKRFIQDEWGWKKAFMATKTRLELYNSRG